MIKIEIDIDSLVKQEKHYEYVTVHPKVGKPFKRKQLKGRKEEPKTPEGSSKKTPVESKTPKVSGTSKESLEMTQEYIKNIEDRKVSGPQHLKQYIVTFKDNSKGLYTVIPQFNDRVGALSYYRASKAIGWNECTETIETKDFPNGKGICQRLVEGGEKPYDGSKGVKIEEKHFDDLSKIFIMDAIAGNYSRQTSGVSIKGDKCYAIDNENWGNKNTAERAMSALDNACSGQGGTAWKQFEMIKWMTKSLDADQLKKFKSYVMKNLKNATEKDWDIDNVYRRYKGYPEVAAKWDVVTDNIDYLKKYLKQSEKS